MLTVKERDLLPGQICVACWNVTMQGTDDIVVLSNNLRLIISRYDNTITFMYIGHGDCEIITCDIDDIDTNVYVILLCWYRYLN